MTRILHRVARRLRNAFGIKSPSEEFTKGCEQLTELMQQGIEQGMKDPLFWWGEDGSIHLREMTQDELASLDACIEIVARAFPGYYDDIDEEKPNNGKT